MEDGNMSQNCTALMNEVGGKAIKSNDPFWSTVGFPPYHYNCRTTFRAVYDYELTEEQKEKLREQRRQAYQRRKEKKEAARKELDKKLEALYDKPKEYQKLYVETYGAKINDSKQNRHIAGNKTLKENASYFENDIATLQKIIDEKAGSGDLLLVNGRLTEIIQDDRLKGFDFNLDGNYVTTNKAKIHYSKTGVHIVPTLKGTNND